MKQKTLTELLIDLDTVERELDQLHTDPDYVKGLSRKVFGDKDYSGRYKETINSIIEMFA